MPLWPAYKWRKLSKYTANKIKSKNTVTRRMCLDPRAQNVGRTNPANADFTIGLNALVLAQLLHNAYLQRRCWRTKRRDVLFNPTKGYNICMILAGGRAADRLRDGHL